MENKNKYCESLDLNIWQCLKFAHLIVSISVVHIMENTNKENNVCNEVFDLNTLVTPPNYKTDRFPFKEIKTSGGRYKRKAKVANFLKDMCLYMSKQVKDLETFSLQ